MLCPFCIQDITIVQVKAKGAAIPAYRCPACKEDVPALYVRDYRKYPPVVVSVIGFRSHGKTVYLASLFYALRKLGLASQWSKFSTKSLNDESLDTILNNVAMLQRGELPPASLANFPRPTLIRTEGIPMQRDCTLLFYDTGGEAFLKANQMVRHASFVRRARTAMLLVSVSDLEDPALDMHKLLNTYVMGMTELGARTKNQHLVVVYTKADELIAQLTQHGKELADYLKSGGMESLAQPHTYMKEMSIVSNRLREFTRSKTAIGASEFVNMAETDFNSVTFTILSALGSKPEGNKLPVEISPRRVLDPLLLLMEKSFPDLLRSFQKWWA